jgi:NAD-dependent dihydropyrimidine dehydrogenase PreA subunit
MPRKLTVVVSQGQSANPAKRKLEEDLVAGLLFERGVEVTVVPHLYDLAPDGTGMLCLQSISGDMVILSWLFERAAFWTLDRNGIRGREGRTLLVNEEEADEDDDESAVLAPGESPGAESPEGDKPRVAAARDLPNRTIWCLDLKVRPDAKSYIDEVVRIRDEHAVQTVSLNGLLGELPIVTTPTARAPDAAGMHPQLLNGTSAPPQPTVIADEGNRRWYPVIDYSRCTNCMECIDFCLFGVYGVDKVDTILVEQPDNCRKGCPACSRVCPENAIIFPQHKTPAIAGSPEGAAGAFKIDLSALFGAPNALEQAVLERDVELVAVGRDAVGAEVGLPKRQDVKAAAEPKDDLDRLMDKLDDLDL